MCGSFCQRVFLQVHEGRTWSLTRLRFFLALLIGVAAAALFGLLIGIPVLRLKGDYLAIVTLAFGEIIKNLVNVLYIGKDSGGFHISTQGCDGAGLQMATDDYQAALRELREHRETLHF